MRKTIPLKDAELYDFCLFDTSGLTLEERSFIGERRGDVISMAATRHRAVITELDQWQEAGAVLVQVDEAPDPESPLIDLGCLKITSGEAVFIDLDSLPLKRLPRASHLKIPPGEYQVFFQIIANWDERHEKAVAAKTSPSVLHLDAWLDRLGTVFGVATVPALVLGIILADVLSSWRPLVPAGISLLLYGALSWTRNRLPALGHLRRAREHLAKNEPPLVLTLTSITEAPTIHKSPAPPCLPAPEPGTRTRALTDDEKKSLKKSEERPDASEWLPAMAFTSLILTLMIAAIVAGVLYLLRAIFDYQIAYDIRKFGAPVFGALCLLGLVAFTILSRKTSRRMRQSNAEIIRHNTVLETTYHLEDAIQVMHHEHKDEGGWFLRTKEGDTVFIPKNEDGGPLLPKNSVTVVSTPDFGHVFAITWSGRSIPVSHALPAFEKTLPEGAARPRTGEKQSLPWSEVTQVFGPPLV